MLYSTSQKMDEGVKISKTNEKKMANWQLETFPNTLLENYPPETSQSIINKKVAEFCRLLPGLQFFCNFFSDYLCVFWRISFYYIFFSFFLKVVHPNKTVLNWIIPIFFSNFLVSALNQFLLYIFFLLDRELSTQKTCFFIEQYAVFSAQIHWVILTKTIFFKGMLHL